VRGSRTSLASLATAVLLSTLAAASAAAAPVGIANSNEGRPILSAAAMAPGDSVRGVVTIANDAPAARGLILAKRALRDRPGPYGGSLSTALLLRVEGRFPGGDGGWRPIYEGGLATMPRLELGRFAAGESRDYRLTATFPNGGAPPSPTTGDNALQGSAMTVRYAWGERRSGAGERPGSAAGRSGQGGEDDLGRAASPGAGGGFPGSAGGTLPFTGLAIALLVAVGLLLAAAGAALRRSWGISARAGGDSDTRSPAPSRSADPRRPAPACASKTTPPLAPAWRRAAASAGRSACRS
jgi:hypothetical protein